MTSLKRLCYAIFMKNIILTFYFLIGLSAQAETYTCRVDENEKYHIILNEGADYVIHDLVGKLTVTSKDIHVERGHDIFVSIAADENIDWEKESRCVVFGGPALVFHIVPGGDSYMQGFIQTFHNPLKPCRSIPDTYPGRPIPLNCSLAE